MAILSLISILGSSMSLKEHPEFKMPFIIKNHSGQQMCQRLDRLVKMLKAQGHEFITFNEFVERVQK